VCVRERDRKKTSGKYELKTHSSLKGCVSVYECVCVYACVWTCVWERERERERDRERTLGMYELKTHSSSVWCVSVWERENEREEQTCMSLCDWKRAWVVYELGAVQHAFSKLILNPKHSSLDTLMRVWEQPIMISVI